TAPVTPPHGARRLPRERPPCARAPMRAHPPCSPPRQPPPHAIGRRHSGRAGSARSCRRRLPAPPVVKVPRSRSQLPHRETTPTTDGTDNTDLLRWLNSGELSLRSRTTSATSQNYPCYPCHPWLTDSSQTPKMSCA